LYPPPVQRLITELGKLPGIGQRTAQRLAFHILRSDADDANALADAIHEVKERIGLCEVCFNLADEARCRICQDERRDATLICVVEEPSSAPTSTAGATTSSAARCRRSTASIPRI
jgi:recombination protein RecR